MSCKIQDICRRIEKKHNVKILFAVESGSRLWGFESLDSDYDVRFVYYRPIKDYIQISKKQEVIEEMYDENLNLIGFSNNYKTLFDFVGFDIFKFSKLLCSSNPSTIEWIKSDILYYGEKEDVFLEFIDKNFSWLSLFYHYRSMCKSNYLKFFKSEKALTYKNYLYVFRGILSAKWVYRYKKVPPMNFDYLLEEFNDILPVEVLVNLKEILRMKKFGAERDIVRRIEVLDEFIDSFLREDFLGLFDEKKEVDSSQLDKYIQKLLL